MIGKTAELPNGKEAIVVGYIRWGTPSHPNLPLLRYIITTFGAKDDKDKRIDAIRKPENVILRK